MNTRQKNKKYKRELELYRKILDRKTLYNCITENFRKIEILKVTRLIDKRYDAPIEIIKNELASELAKCLIKNNLVRFKISENNMQTICAEISVVKEKAL